MDDQDGLRSSEGKSGGGRLQIADRMFSSAGRDDTSVKLTHEHPDWDEKRISRRLPRISHGGSLILLSACDWSRGGDGARNSSRLPLQHFVGESRFTMTSTSLWISLNNRSPSSRTFFLKNSLREFAPPRMRYCGWAIQPHHRTGVEAEYHPNEARSMNRDFRGSAVHEQRSRGCETSRDAEDSSDAIGTSPYCAGGRYGQKSGAVHG